MTRIRYHKNEMGSLVSKPLQTLTDKVIVMIETTGEFKIINSKAERIYQNQETKPLHLAKKLAKKALIELGCNFTPEVRPRHETPMEIAKEAYNNELALDHAKTLEEM